MPRGQTIFYKQGHFWGTFSTFLALFGLGLGFAVTGRDVLAHWLFGFSTVFAIITFLIIANYYRIHRLWETVGSIAMVVGMFVVDGSATGRFVKTPPLQPATAIFMESDIVGLPIHVNKGESVYVVPLNKKRLESNGWGFYDVAGSAEGDQWPPKRLMQKSSKQPNFGTFAYKCKVSNHGPQQVVYLGIPIDIFFGTGKPTKNNTRRYTALISALDSGKDFEFYLVNDCSENVNAIWQEDASVQLLGEPSKIQIKLRRTYRSPVDQIMMLFGTSVRWIGGEPCE